MMRPPICAFAAVIAFLVVSPRSEAVAADSLVQNALVSIIEHISGGQPYQLEGEAVAAVKVVPDLYSRRDSQPAWTNQKAIDDFLSAIKRIDEDGLDSGDYHLRSIERLMRQTKSSRDPVVRAELDVLLTDGLARLG